jgi:hypothetical protein
VNLPLKIIRSWVFLLGIGTEWADVSWALVDKTMAYHLVLLFEPLSTFAPYATSDWTIMRSI